MSCDICGGRGSVYRAVVEGGHVMWNEPSEVPDVMECPLCYLANLTGVR